MQSSSSALKDGGQSSLQLLPSRGRESTAGIRGGSSAGGGGRSDASGGGGGGGRGVNGAEQQEGFKARFEITGRFVNLGETATPLTAFIYVYRNDSKRVVYFSLPTTVLHESAPTEYKLRLSVMRSSSVLARAKLYEVDCDLVQSVETGRNTRDTRVGWRH
jgi:hypothetical protein